MEVLTVAALKGGTGKTTTAAILAQAAATEQKKVLAIDLDPQQNLSLILGANLKLDYDVIDLLTDAKQLPIPQTVNGIDIIQSNINLATEPLNNNMLCDALERWVAAKSYDLIIIDTPAAITLQQNALKAADSLIIPLQANILCLQSLRQLIESIKLANPNINIKGFIFNQFDDRSTIVKQMKDAIIIEANKLNISYLGSVHTAIAVQEAAALQQNIFEYAPKSKPAIDYMNIYKQLFE